MTVAGISTEVDKNLEDGGQRTMRFCVLGSSSYGNCTLVSFGDNSILIDAGLPVRYTASKVKEITGKEKVEGIFVSHEHSDHTRNLFPLSKKLDSPVYLSPPVSWYLGDTDGAEVRHISDGVPVRIGDLTITPFIVPHDAIDPFGFIISSAGGSIGLITDLGNVDDRIIELLRNREGLVIESNHDMDMLLKGRYPGYLKSRIMDGRGHLSNQQCGQLLKEVIGPLTRDVVLVHLSEENNDPLLALETSMEALECSHHNPRVHVSYPRNPTEVIDINRN
ncbi:MAG: MBL fold metallo-hydrolase [Thermoplasmatota archaeon]